MMMTKSSANSVLARVSSECPWHKSKLWSKERIEAKQRRDFTRSDQIRQQLAESGIILEDTRDGSVRWKYK